MDDNEYEIKAIIRKSGGIYSGHYTVYCKEDNNNDIIR